MRLWRRLSFLFRRQRFDSDLAEEMRLHVHLREQQLQRDGSTPASAHRKARLQFGNTFALRDQSRDAWLFRWPEDMLQDLRFARRTCAKHLVFTAIAIATLALGIGAATAVFSVVEAVLLQPLPYRNPDRVIVIWDRHRRDREGQTVASFEDFEAYRRNAKLVTDISAVGLTRPTLDERGARRKYLAGILTPSTFDALGTPPALGIARLSGAEGCAVVISHAFWTNGLSSDSAVIGRTLNLDGSPCVVRAVMPRNFRFYPRRADMWFFLGHDPAGRQRVPYAVIFARLGAGVTLAQAVAELRAIHASLHARDDHGQDREADADDAQRELTYLSSSTLRSTLIVLFCSVAALLFVACLNVGGLLLARFIERKTEFVVRSALGCGQGRVIRQTLAEGMLLSLPGAVLGTCLAASLIRFFPWGRTAEIPEGVTVSLNLPVLIFAVMASAGAVIVSGLAPAFFAAQTNLRSSLGNAARGLLGTAHGVRMSQWIIAAQVAVSFVVLAGAIVLADSVRHLETTPLGFRTENITTTSVNLAKYANANARIHFQNALLNRLQDLPGVAAAGIGSFFPPYREGGIERLEVRGTVSNDNVYDVLSCAVSPRYFDVLGTHLLRGRHFDEHDRQGGAAVAIVSAALANKYFPGQDPLGKEIRVARFFDTSPWMSIVGVVADWKHLEWDARWADSRLVFRPLVQSGDPEFEIGIHTHHNLVDEGLAIREAILSLDDSIPSEPVRTVDAAVARMRAYPRFRAFVVIFLALAALAVTTAGLHGTLHQIVSRRKPEFGLRRTVGAQTGDLLWLVARQGGAPVLAGTVIGIAALPVIARVMGRFFVGLRMADPRAMAAGALVLFIVSACTITWPAWRAAKVDPSSALREE